MPARMSRTEYTLQLREHRAVPDIGLFRMTVGRPGDRAAAWDDFAVGDCLAKVVN